MLESALRVSNWQYCDISDCTGGAGEVHMYCLYQGQEILIMLNVINSDLDCKFFRTFGVGT